MIVTDAWEPQVNGVVTTLRATQAQLEARGHEVKVVHPGLFKTMACPGYPEIRLSLMPRARLARMIDEWDPDFIHVATEGPLGLAVRKILSRRGQRWSSSLHTKFAEYVESRLGWGAGLVWSWLRRTYRRDAKILVTTESMRSELVQRGFDDDQLITWGRGVDGTVFKPRPSWLNDYPSNRAPKPILMNVGRVSVEKNLEAFYELDLPGTKIQVGDGPMLESYKSRYPDVLFIGARRGADLAECYSGADVMVFPSRSDTFGLVMIESMRCGTPVAAHPVTGPVDVITEGKNGAMDDDLGEAVRRALAVSRVNVVRYSEQFTWEAATDQFIKALVPRR